MAFTPKDWRLIFAEKAAFIIANSPINVIYPSSIIARILEATSLEDAEQYYQMLEIIEAYNLDSTFGEDLDKRAIEVSLDPLRKDESEATTNVTISDSAFFLPLHAREKWQRGVRDCLALFSSYCPSGPWAYPWLTVDTIQGSRLPTYKAKRVPNRETPG